MKKVMTSLALVGLLSAAAVAEVRVYRVTESVQYLNAVDDRGYSTSSDYSLADTNVIEVSYTCDTDSIVLATLTNATFNVSGRDPRIEPTFTFNKVKYDDTYYVVVPFDANGNVMSNQVVKAGGVTGTSIECDGSVVTNTADAVTNWYNVAELSVYDARLKKDSSDKGKKVRVIETDYYYGGSAGAVATAGWETFPIDDYYAGKAKKSFAKKFGENWKGNESEVDTAYWGCGYTNELLHIDYIYQKRKTTIKYDADLSKLATGKASFSDAVDAVANKLAGKNGVLENNITEEEVAVSGYTLSVDAEDYYCASTSSVFSVSVDIDDSSTYYYNGLIVSYE